MNTLTKIFARRAKLMIAPFLLNPAEYWGYIQTKQAFLQANRSIVRIQLLMGLFFSWVVVFGFLSAILSVKAMWVLALALNIFFVLWYWMTVNKKWWYGLTLLLSFAAIGLIFSFFYESGILVKTFGLAYVAVAYIVLGHLIMLVRVKGLADATR